MDYVAAATNNLGYVQTVEKLYSVEVPRRARYIRHGAVGAAARSQPPAVARHARGRLGASPSCCSASRAGARVDLFEEYAAARLTYQHDANRRQPVDVPPGGKKVLAFCRRAESRSCRSTTTAHEQRIFMGAHQGHRGHQRGRASPWGCAAAAARLRRLPATSARTSRTRRTTRWNRRAAGRPRDTYRPYLVRLEGVPAVAADHPAGGAGPPRGPIMGKVARLIKRPAGET